jgi:hypothetical protein
MNKPDLNKLELCITDTLALLQVHKDKLDKEAADALQGMLEESLKQFLRVTNGKD